ncbi:MAG: hypothetical protein KF687_16555 [Cyclobacteriaceae bacterium]|nr:hypothetical protein [Cyclobacteriaceae bacterium]
MKSILTISAIAFLLAFSACSSDDAVNERDQQINLLTSAPWITQSVMHATDGDLTDQYQNFSITFIKNPVSGFDGDYFVVNGSYAFPEPSGKWKFSNDLTKLIFINGQDLDASVTNSLLTLHFVVASPGGRTTGLSGQFTFVLKH